MFETFFTGLQSDLLLSLWAAVVCAGFRCLFIALYGPKESKRNWARLRGCFRYGFWWGMDFNAYVFLLGMILVSIPASLLPGYQAVSAEVRTGLFMLYLTVIYLASWANMIFYYHFHDIFNSLVRLGGNADKKNFADIFFNQNHGGWILAGFIPYAMVTGWITYAICQLPKLEYVSIQPAWLQYALNTVVFVMAVLLFYWLRYGGTFDHRKKPEWDEVPVDVKKDEFLGKMTLDALVALELAWRSGLCESLRHTEEESREIMATILPPTTDWQAPLECFKRQAHGAQINKPRKIFFLFAESHGQAPFDYIYQKLNLMEASQKFRKNEHTVAINNFLPGGMVSAPSLASLLSGIYDTGLELNENRSFWQGYLPVSLPVQLRKLGYRTEFWYGGGLNWGSLEHFVPAVGFDVAHGGPDICAKDAPRTWLGVYDHLFLEAAAKRIEAGNPEDYEFHFLYTTSNHGPYNMPYDEYGADLERIMPEAPAALKRDKRESRKMQGIWYTDQALCAFIERMQKKYPDALFIVTGDHTTGLIPYQFGVTDREEPTLREQVLTSFAMYHRELTPEMLAGNTIGGHLNILPTIIELIAPQGHEYYSLFPALTEHIDHVVTPYCYLTEEMVGDYRSNVCQSLKVSKEKLPLEHQVVYMDERDAYCEVSGYFVKHPELLLMKKELIDSLPN